MDWVRDPIVGGHFYQHGDLLIMSATNQLLMHALCGELDEIEDDVARCVVRLTTNCYLSGGRAVFSKVISRLKRKSQLSFDEIGFDHDAEIDFNAITNLMTVPDGVYYLDPDETDWDSDEYGYSIHWYAVSWKLVPYTK